MLRCHSWKNVPVHKVQYFQDGRGRQFSYRNSAFHIPRASAEHNGSYFCRGLIGKLNVSSEAVAVLVEGEGCRRTARPGRWLSHRVSLNPNFCNKDY